MERRDDLEWFYGKDKLAEIQALLERMLAASLPGHKQFPRERYIKMLNAIKREGAAYE